MSEIKKTVLNDWHKNNGAKLVDFAGWEMPILYTGLIEEHNTVRENVGLFDVSHMGVIFFKGEKALDFLQFVTSNDISKVKAGKAQYNSLMREDGGLVDDIILYCEGASSYFAIVNASNIEKDYKHFLKYNNYNVEINNRSNDFGLIAIQGPKAEKLISEVLSSEVSKLKYFSHDNFSFNTKEESTQVKVARTGYTGEDGFEVLVENKFAETLWTVLLEAGSDHGIKPIGLGARDTLRLEACYSLYGHELGEDISLIESGLGWICKCNKGEFLGKDIVCNEKAKWNH
jgi:aminomethyltransferase